MGIARKVLGISAGVLLVLLLAPIVISLIVAATGPGIYNGLIEPILCGRTLRRVFAQDIRPGEDPRYEVVCYDGAERIESDAACSTLIGELPAVKDIYCTFLVEPHDACCVVTFRDGTRLESHVKKQESSYSLPIQLHHRQEAALSSPGP